MMGDIIKGHPNTDIINALEHNKLCRLSYSNNRILHIANKYPQHVIIQMNLLRERKELCDVMIKVGSRCLHAHRAILSAASPYFYAMFTGHMSESKDSEITIHEISDLAIEQLIDFIYTATIVIEEGNVQTLLPAACLLQMIDIQEACCEFLKNQLDPTNCLGIRAFADTHSCRELLKIADQFTQNNFLEVIINEEFLLLPYEQLIEILSSDELNVRNEEQVFKAVMAWVKFNLPERKSMLYNVLEYVRLPLINPKFLVEIVGNDPLIKRDDMCRDLVDEAKNYLLLPQERCAMQGPRTKPRKIMRRGEVLFVAGGWCNGDAISTVERYDPETNEWRMAAPMVKRRCGVGVAVLNDLLYAVGGHDGLSYLNTIERYDPRMNVWSCDVSPTSTCRTSVGVAAHDNYLYAVGGQDGVSCLNLVERYNPTTNRWFKIASMKTRRLGVAVAVLGSYLYAVGGADGTMPLNTVERYDPSTNKWTYVAPMGTRRKHLGVTVYNNHLYAIGGRDNTTELSSAERYNPQTNKWTPIVAMTSRRSGVGLAVVNGLLVAVGGFDGSAYLKTIEVYDPALGSWKLCGSMNYRRLGGGVGVLKVPGSLGGPPDPTLDLSPKQHDDEISSLELYEQRNLQGRDMANPGSSSADCQTHCLKMISCCARCHRTDVFYNPELLNDVAMGEGSSSPLLPDTCIPTSSITSSIDRLLPIINNQSVVPSPNLANLTNSSLHACSLTGENEFCTQSSSNLNDNHVESEASCVTENYADNEETRN